MKKLILPMALFATTALLTHFWLVRSIPSLIMKVAMTKFEERGVPLHHFTRTPRTTPKNQTIVRPSPDLAYSVCPFDFKGGNAPLLVGAVHWRDYGSISFYDAKTNNFASISVGFAKSDDDQTHVLLLPPSTKAGPDKVAYDGGHDIKQQIASPTQSGLIVIRRLAPRLEDDQAVGEISDQDVCQLIGG